jgi:hypothetical protein
MITLLSHSKFLIFLLLATVTNPPAMSQEEKDDLANLVCSMKGKAVFVKVLCDEKNSFYGRVTEVQKDYFIVAMAGSLRCIPFLAVGYMESIGGAKDPLVTFYLH